MSAARTKRWERRDSLGGPAATDFSMMNAPRERCERIAVSDGQMHDDEKHSAGSRAFPLVLTRHWMPLLLRPPSLHTTIACRLRWEAQWMHVLLYNVACVGAATCATGNGCQMPPRAQITNRPGAVDVEIVQARCSALGVAVSLPGVCSCYLVVCRKRVCTRLRPLPRL